jgi:protein-S-isoprenylcysteine O-methyltransferase Ste14
MPVSSYLRYRVPIGFLFAVAYLWLLKSNTPQNLIPCIVLVALGCALRSWAAGYLFKGKRVAIGGPYAYVRNPLYVGSFLIGAGFCLGFYQEPLPPSVLVFWLIYIFGFVLLYAAKGHSEEDELAKALGPDYVIYRSRVPAFIPVRGRVSGLGHQHFSLELYRRNREYQCILGSLAILFLILWKAQYGS